MEVERNMRSIREKSMLQSNSFSSIYNNPLSFVRVIEKDQLDNESNFPAHIIHKNGCAIPQRLQESGMMILNTNEVLLQSKFSR